MSSELYILDKLRQQKNWLETFLTNPNYDTNKVDFINMIESTKQAIDNIKNKYVTSVYSDYKIYKDCIFTNIFYAENIYRVVAFECRYLETTGLYYNIRYVKDKLNNKVYVAKRYHCKFISLIGECSHILQLDNKI